MGRISGTVRKVTLDGVTFSVKADIDINKKLSSYENDVLPTVGEGILKKTKTNPNWESVNLQTSPEEDAILKNLNDRTKPFTMSVELADRSVYSSTGYINWSGTTTAENVGSLTLMPINSEAGWTPFFS